MTHGDANDTAPAARDSSAASRYGPEITVSVTAGTSAARPDGAGRRAALGGDRRHGVDQLRRIGDRLEPDVGDPTLLVDHDGGRDRAGREAANGEQSAHRGV